MKTSLKSLIGKLNPLTRRAMESAANVALSRTHHEADVERFLREEVFPFQPGVIDQLAGGTRPEYAKG